MLTIQGDGDVIRLVVADLQRTFKDAAAANFYVHVGETRYVGALQNGGRMRSGKVLLGVRA